MRETDLYKPIKQLLESQGYEVKAEVGPADVVAMRGDEPPVIVELKTSFSLSLFHQATDRQSITDSVYIAVPAGKGRKAWKALQKNLKLCRLLGLGLITVRPADSHVEVLADPVPYRPRQSKRRKRLLLREFARRTGDPNTGGSARRKLVTAYRQDAIKCVEFLSENGATKAAKVAEGTGVTNARRIMADNHYGWFRRVSTGIYGLERKAADE
ncbi:MAG TPA: DUF2161 family putative PD-(D/E)XK-type phosphodiesterase [Gammaproteobacteria bacterium]|nr:DUF2161 family putative PD-(D/E)XK-type phosphodiesterase [Gammaproteobacteria bacterium]